MHRSVFGFAFRCLRQREAKLKFENGPNAALKRRSTKTQPVKACPFKARYRYKKT